MIFIIIITGEDVMRNEINEWFECVCCVGFCRWWFLFPRRAANR